MRYFQSEAQFSPAGLKILARFGQTGLGFSAQAEFPPGLKKSPCNRQFDFKRICFRSRAEIRHVIRPLAGRAGEYGPLNWPITARVLTPWAGKTNQIARCDWLSEWARWSYLTRSGLAAVCLITILWTSTPSRSINAGKELGQYLAILTEKAWSVTHIYYAPTSK